MSPQGISRAGIEALYIKWSLPKEIQRFSYRQRNNKIFPRTSSEFIVPFKIQPNFQTLPNIPICGNRTTANEDKTNKFKSVLSFLLIFTHVISLFYLKGENRKSLSPTILERCGLQTLHIRLLFVFAVIVFLVNTFIIPQFTFTPSGKKDVVRQSPKVMAISLFYFVFMDNNIIRT